MAQSFVRMIGASALVAAAAIASAGLAAVPVGPKTVTSAPAKRYDAKRSLFGRWLGGGSWGRRARRGWSNAQVRRMAQKRRNVLRAKRRGR